MKEFIIIPAFEEGFQIGELKAQSVDPYDFGGMVLKRATLAEIDVADIYSVASPIKGRLTSFFIIDLDGQVISENELKANEAEQF